jgi:hypothetical protein
MYKTSKKLQINSKKHQSIYYVLNLMDSQVSFKSITNLL